ncbi:aminotransferase class I/II-fold pyridoxal phosphate-dependent enzyme [Actinokineospora sp.]|uniref:aminotransferase class I/II-fold pyridoxal phosphate-dependent enzyme n=1 Tax=Actinokineospora sp. TaxID=1872133 RepID=UPI00403769F3
MPTDVFAKTHDNHIRSLTRQLAGVGRYPYFSLMEGPPSAVTIMDGVPCVNLGSSNYLGLSGDARVATGAHQATLRYGTSLNGSRVMNGTVPLHLELEAEVAEWLGEGDALIYPSGYAANLGVISALVGADEVAICDGGDHASILDGATLARGRLMPFQHNRLDRLDAVLDRTRRDGTGTLVVVDSVYSMQGDMSDLAGVTAAARRHGARLLVDEAHAFGILGPRGQGVAALAGLVDAIDLRMGTFSKALAGGGGFVTGPAHVIDYLRTNSRPFLFTAATPPAGLGAAQAALRIVLSAEGDDKRGRLTANAARLREALAGLGFDVPPAPRLIDGTEVQTPILQVRMRDEGSAVLAWSALFDAGVYVNPAIYPAVPKGNPQLRLSVQSEHTDRHLDRVIDAFTAVREADEAAPEDGLVALR